MNPRWGGPALAVVLALAVHGVVLGWPVAQAPRPRSPSSVAVSLAPRPQPPSALAPTATPAPAASGATAPDPADLAVPSSIPSPPLEINPGSSEGPQTGATAEAEALGDDQGNSIGGRSEGPQVAFDFDAWANQVRQGVDAHKAYPYAARSRGLEGRVSVAVSVTPEGHLAGEPRVTRSSGYAVLDRAAVAAVNQAAPFPPVPQDSPRELELTLVFTLR